LIFDLTNRFEVEDRSENFGRSSAILEFGHCRSAKPNEINIGEKNENILVSIVRKSYPIVFRRRADGKSD